MQNFELCSGPLATACLAAAPTTGVVDNSFELGFISFALHELEVEERHQATNKALSCSTLSSVATMILPRTC